jgi:uncharacterized protein (TIGR02145 family)
VPTDEEWSIITTFLGGVNVAGGPMKSTATQPVIAGWYSPNTGATNSSGFEGLPGGYRAIGGGYFDLNQKGYWWSSTPSASASGWLRYLVFNGSNVTRVGFDKRGGASVRCLLD